MPSSRCDKGQPHQTVTFQLLRTCTDRKEYSVQFTKTHDHRHFGQNLVFFEKRISTFLPVALLPSVLAPGSPSLLAPEPLGGCWAGRPALRSSPVHLASFLLVVGQNLPFPEVWTHSGFLHVTVCLVFLGQGLSFEGPVMGSKCPVSCFSEADLHSCVFQ